MSFKSHPSPFSVRFAVLQLACLSLVPAGCGTVHAGGPAPFVETAWASQPTTTDTPASPPSTPDSAAFLEFPSLSPDGQWAVFSAAGDLWAVPTSGGGGGVATRLTSHPAEERRSAFSPDGSLLAFESDRDGSRNIYVMPVAVTGGTLVAGTPARLTVSDRNETLGSFSADGTAVYFNSDRSPAIYSGQRMFRVDVRSASDDLNGPSGRGGVVTPLTEAFGTLPRAQPGAAGAGRMVFTRHRPSMERPKYRGSGSQDVYSLDFATGAFTRLTTHNANDGEAFALPDGSTVFISSRDGQNNLWKIAAGENDLDAVQLTRFAPTREQYTIAHGVRDLAVSDNGQAAVFAVWDRLYALDLSQPNPAPRAIDVRLAGDASFGAAFDRRNLEKDASEAVLSPDGKTIAIAARGEVFVRSTQEGYPTRRVTETIGRERDLAWSPDGQYLYFSSDEPTTEAQRAALAKSKSEAEAAAAESSKPVEVMNDPRPSGAPGLFRASVKLAREDLKPKDKKSDDSDAAKKDPEKKDSDKKEADKKDDDKGSSDKKDADKKKEPEGPDHGKRWAESLTFTVEPLVLLSTDARGPTPSPDGQWLIYTRGLGDIVLRSVETGAEKVVVESVLESSVQWAEDSRHLVCELTDLDYNADVWIIDAGEMIDALKPKKLEASDDDEKDDDEKKDDSTPGADQKPSSDQSETDAKQEQADQDKKDEPIDRTGWERLPTGVWGANITRHPDNDGSPRLSADGKVLVFLSERGGASDELDVWTVFLDKELESKTAYELDEYIKKAAETAGKRKPLPSKPSKKVDAKSNESDKGAKAEPASITPASSDPKPAEPKPSEPTTNEPQPDDKKSDPVASKTKDDEAKSKDEKADAADAKPKKKPADKAIKPFKFDVSDAYLRVRQVTTVPGSEGDLALTPGADRIIFSATIDGERQLFSIDHKGKDRKQIVAGDVRAVRVGLTGEKLSYIKGGVASLAPKAGGKAESMSIDAPVVIDLAAQQRQKFHEAARTLGEGFYHPTLKGLDWSTLTKRYADLAARTRHSSSFNRVVNMLFGELDGSHLGIFGGDRFSAPGVNTGYLGTRAKPVLGGFEVTRVTLATPADEPLTKINVGDVIVSIDGVRLAKDDTSMPTIDLDAALAGKAGKEVLVEVRAAAKPAAAADATPSSTPADAAPATRTLIITPISFVAWDSLDYQDEVLRRRAQVEKLSGGKLGYLHIRAMGEDSVREFERDLYAAANGKDGLIIDVRDNGGGYTADILLSSLTAPRHAYTAARGVDPTKVRRDVYPRDRRLIYAWTRPINVLINQNSFSNAEIFAHAIKTINRGKLIGTATFGGVISTGAATLIDGTTIRTPFRGWYLPDGSDLENNGARPDISVPQEPQDEAAERDPQLEAAVKELMGRV